MTGPPEQIIIKVPLSLGVCFGLTFIYMVILALGGIWDLVTRGKPMNYDEETLDEMDRLEALYNPDPDDEDGCNSIPVDEEMVRQSEADFRAGGFQTAD